jgi:AraC-like DNA-binding protein
VIGKNNPADYDRVFARENGMLDGGSEYSSTIPKRACARTRLFCAMALIKTQTSGISELWWLSEVRERTHPLSEQCPIWVRHGTVDAGSTCAHPERHPYYELGTNFGGVVTQWVRKENTERLPGDLFFAGPGLPHYSTGKIYPLHFVTVFFLPSVLLGMGPITDGARILRRFTMKQNLATQLLRLPPKLRADSLESFREIVREFEGHAIGREMRLRSLLTQMIVEVIRWEQREGTSPANDEQANDWRTLERALAYLHERFREPVYAQALSQHAGVSESRLKQLFHDTLGMPWSRYLQFYRIQRALDHLGLPGRNVSETALAVGFESLSHFNSTFRTLMGMSPRAYAHKALPQPAG